LPYITTGMETEYIINKLQQNIAVFEAALVNIGREEYVWKPQPDKWCLLEVICHLCDEEREDFRARVKHILLTPGVEMKSINPAGWVLERKYMEQSFDEKLTEFIMERKSSIEWLQSLKDAAWNNIYHHPKLGAMSAAMVLANWLAHDYLHTRQITGLKHGYLAGISGQDLSYAGNW
jgi:hypothetical protein